MSRGSAAAVLLRMELRALLRDRRTIFFSIVLPLLVMPLMLLATSRLKRAEVDRAKNKTYVYAVAGARAGSARAYLMDAARAKPAGDDRGARGAADALSMSEVEAADPARSLAAGDLDFYVEELTTEEVKAAHYGEPPRADADAAPEPAGVPIIVIHYRADRSPSRAAHEKLLRRFQDLRRERRDALLEARGFPGASAAVLRVEAVDLATEDQRKGSRTGRFLTAFVLLFMLVGGATVASDSIAGEKERGTLETLLSTAASRSSIIAAKLLLIGTVTLTTTTVQLANFYVCAALGLVDKTGDLGAFVSPANALVLFALYLPVSLLVASALLLTSGVANSYKEAQLYFTPLTLLGPLLALAPVLPGIELRSAIVLVPLANISVAAREVLLGRPDWPMVALAWLVTTAAGVQVARLATRVLSNERLILPSIAEAAEIKGGPALFRRRAPRWFAALWAAFVVASVNGGALGLVGGALIGQAVFVVAAALMILAYRLPVREALGLRAVKPRVWLGVLLGAPCGAVAATGVYRLASLLLKVPEQTLEQFGKDLLPGDMPIWQLALLMAALPAVVEEITFRGLLLYGLRQRLRPAMVCLVVGVVFGLFHLALFRLATTTFLGIVLTAVAMLTGSIVPGMLWHALNNALPLLALKSGVVAADPPLWAYPIAVVGLGVAFWIFYSASPGRDASAPRGTP